MNWKKRFEILIACTRSRKQKDMDTNRSISEIREIFSRLMRFFVQKVRYRHYLNYYNLPPNGNGAKSNG